MFLPPLYTVPDSLVVSRIFHFWKLKPMEVLDDSPCPVRIILVRSTGQTDQKILDHLEIEEEDRNLLIFAEFANSLQNDLCGLAD